MYAQKRGIEYENDLVRDVYEHPDSDVVPVPCGMSGNHGVPAGDVLVDDGEQLHAFELKRTSEDSKSFVYEPDPGLRDDISDLLVFAKEYPRPVCPYVGVRFDNRQLILAKIWQKSSDDSQLLDSIVTTAPTEAIVTHAGNVSFRKPDSDKSSAEWPSATAGNDAEYLLETIGELERDD